MADLRFNVSAETREATQRLGAFAQDVQRKLVAAVRSLPDIELTADSTDAQREMKRIRDDLAALANKRVGVDIDAGAALAEMARLQGELRTLGGSTTEVGVRADVAAAERALGDVEADVRRLNGADAEVEVTADTGPAERELEEFGDGAKAAAAAAGAAAGAAMVLGISSNLEMGQVQANLTAQLGLTAEESKRIGGVAGALYANAYGENLTEVGDAVAVVIQNVEGIAAATDEELQAVTGQMISLAQVMQVDVGEAATAVGQLIRTGLAQNATEAMDLLVAGAQEGANKYGDLADTITGSSATLAQFGFDGKTAIGAITQAMDAGAPSADFFIGALEELAGNAGDSVEVFDSLGLSGEEMARKLTGGGAGAREALQQLMDKLRAMQDPAARSTALVGLFGEEATAMQGALLAIDPSTASAALGDFAGKAAEADAALGDLAQNKITALTRGFEQWTASLVATEGPIGDVAAGIEVFGPMAVTALAGIAPLIIALKMGGIAAAIGGVATATAGVGTAAAGAAGAAGAGRLLGVLGGLATFLASPLGIALGAAAGITYLFMQRNQEAADAVAAHEGAVSTLKGTLDQYTGAVTEATIAQQSQDIAARKLSDGNTTFAAALRGVGISFDDYTAAASGNEEALGRVNSQLFTAAARMPGLQDLYARWKPRLDEAGVSFETFTAAAIGNGDAFDDLTTSLGVQASGFDAWRQDLDAAVGPVGELGSAIGEYAGTLAEAQAQTRLAADASAGFTDVLDAVRSGLAGLKGGAEPLPPMAEAFERLSATASTAATAAGTAAAEFGGVAAGAAAAEQSMFASRTAFVEAALAAGLSSDEANRLADTIGLIPVAASTTFTLLADIDPAIAGVQSAIAFADGSTGTVTLDGDPQMVNGKIVQAVVFADGSRGVMSLDANPNPATGQINGVVQYGNGRVTTVTINPRDLATPVLNNLNGRQTSSTHYIRVVQTGAVGGFAGAVRPGGAGGGLVGFAGGGVVGDPVRLARGGVIAGYSPGVDTVPAMLSRGEAVLVPELVRQIGPRNILAANAAASGRAPTFWSGGGVAHFAAGGVVEDLADRVRRSVAAPARVAAAVTGAMTRQAEAGAVAVADAAVAGHLRALRSELAAANTGPAQLAALAGIAGRLATAAVPSAAAQADSGLTRTRLGAW